MQWQPIETAPKDVPVLLFGMTRPDSRMVRYKRPVVFSGYWCRLDEAWCAHGSHWDGPFFEPTHWTPLPEPPKPVVKDVTMEIVVNGTRTKTTWTFVDGQMTSTAAVEVIR